jgi:hypothetical protein
MVHFIFLLLEGNKNMDYQPFLISPFGTGLDTDMQPWLLPQDAFSDMINANIRHGIVQKRNGYTKQGDIVHSNGANWNISAITQANPGVVTVTSTTGISNGDTVELRSVSGMTEVNGNQYTVANVAPTTFELSGTDTTGFTAYTSGGAVYLVPKNRVMGLERYVDSSNIKEVLAFDTKRAAKFDSTNEEYVPLDTADIMSGSDTNYIWADNWASTASTASSTVYRLYFTNGKALSGGLDGIRYYDGGSTTTSFAPLINGTTTINGCKLLFAFKQRLLLLHTFEGANTYPQRARWCQVQLPSGSNAWDDNVAGRGGFVDAPTGDHIISARFLQDVLIVFFTNSVWALRTTPDPSLPFRWDKINDFRASDGKMASEQFDRYVVSFGIRGITATDGVETRRFDERIEDFVTSEINDAEFGKVFSKRDFGNRKLWTLYPGIEGDDAESALIYNEESGSFSKYDISMNVLGYGGVSQDTAISDFPTEGIDDLGENTLQDYYYDEGTENFLGGNRSGEVFVLEDGGDDNGSSINFNLTSAAWNPWMSEGKKAQLGYIDIFFDSHQTTNLDVQFFVNNEQNPYAEKRINLLPNLTEISEVSNITQANPGNVTSNQHGLSSGEDVYIYGVDGMDDVNGGPYTVTVVDNNNFTIGIDTSAFSAYTNGGTITELPFVSEKVWKRIYASGTGYQHKIKINSDGIDRGIKIHAFMPWFRPVSERPV